MKIAIFSTKQYELTYFEEINKNFFFNLEYYHFSLSEKTAKLAENCDAVCIFVNDEAHRKVLEELSNIGVKIIALRCSGFNNVDIKAAKDLGIKVVRVPAYSPEAVAEHAVGMMLCLNRNIHRAYLRTRDANFSLDGLTGFNMHNRIAGVISTGNIGLAIIKILKGFGMKILAYDPFPNKEALDLGVRYVDLTTLYKNADIITLHCPLTEENYHLLNSSSFDIMKDGVMIINTSRGALIDTTAVIEALKNKKVGALGLDVYENEKGLFFEDKSNDIILDDNFRNLSAFHNVLFTGHQAFLTDEALSKIINITFDNIRDIQENGACMNLLNP